jgi:DnaJ-class molecular chaperone
MTGRHDYPELADLPVPTAARVQCSHCYGSGWKETHQDEVTQLGSGWRCVFCSGTGFVWTEQQQELHDQAAEARRRLTRARYLP